MSNAVVDLQVPQAAVATVPPETVPQEATLWPFVGASRWHRVFVAEVRQKADAVGLQTIVGPRGVGKTLAARHFHWHSRRALSPCHVIDLRQIPAEAVESELFGYARSGIFHRRSHIAGRVAAATEGTCIVQGIEQTPAEIQEHLLPWFAGDPVRPAGSDIAERFSARIIVELRHPAFPKAKECPVITPIYQLLEQSVVEIPPLSARRDDILPIADHYLHCYAEAWGIPARPWGHEAKRLLQRAPWHDGARGLLGAVAAALQTGAGERIEAHHLPPWVAGNIVDATPLGLDGIALEELVERKLALFFQRLGRYDVHDLHDTVIERVERPLLRLVLERTGGNQLRAAQLLGMNRNTLRSRLKRLKLK